MSQVSRIIATVCCAVVLAGCGYRQAGTYDGKEEPGYKWHSLYRQDVNTVAVPIFTNKSFSRGVEMYLTKAVINQLEAKTPYKVVDRTRADTILEGEITGVRVETMSRSLSTELPQEQRVMITVNFLWKNLRTGKILVQKQGFEYSGIYYPTLGEDRFIGNELAVNQLALELVEELQAEW